MPNAHRLAAEQLEVALRETPKDVTARHALGDCYVKSGGFQRAAEVLEPLLSHQYNTRVKTYPLLLECYTHLGELVKAAEMRNYIGN